MRDVRIRTLKEICWDGASECSGRPALGFRGCAEGGSAERWWQRDERQAPGTDPRAVVTPRASAANDYRQKWTPWQCWGPDVWSEYRWADLRCWQSCSSWKLRGGACSMHGSRLPWHGSCLPWHGSRLLWHGSRLPWRGSRLPWLLAILARGYVTAVSAPAHVASPSLRAFTWASSFSPCWSYGAITDTQCCRNLCCTAKWSSSVYILSFSYIYMYFIVICSSLCYAVGPCCWSILYIMVCICSPPSSPCLPPPHPLATTSLLSMSVALSLFCR